MSKKKYTPTKKDIILVAIYLLFIIVDVIIYIVINSSVAMGYIIGGIIERIILITLSFVGLIGIGNSSGWSILVPDFFEENLLKKRKEELHEFMDAYFKKDINFLNDYSEERIQFIMTQLGITTAQLDKLRLELINMRCIPIKNINDAKKKIECVIKSDYPIIVNQDNYDSSKLCYKRVKYFINFNDLVFIRMYALELAQIMSFLINDSITNIKSIDRIIIPHDSNFLLGVEVGKIISKPVVKMRAKQGRIETEKCWDGKLETTDRVIIIHDVLVTAEQIEHTLKMIPKTCDVLAIYCLITRKEYDGLKKIEEEGISVNRIVDLDDNDIAIIRGESNE